MNSEEPRKTGRTNSTEKEKTMVKTKVTVNRDIPRNRNELNEKLAELGRVNRVRDKIVIEMNEAIERIKQRYSEEVKVHDERIKSIAGGIESYCEVHREELTDGGKTKTVVLPAGEISWRKCPPSVRLTKPEVIIELLKKKGLSRFIRIKEEISKDLILADTAAVVGIKGISIVSEKEELTIQPNEETLESAA